MAKENNEKVYVIDFIKKYNGLTSDKAKETYLSSMVTEGVYVPYITKMVTANRLLQSAHLIEDRVVFNTPKEFQMYIFTLIMLYTELDMDGDSTEIFDDLTKYGLVDKLLEEIEKKNESDYKDFNTVFKMVKDDFLMNFAKTNLDTEAIVNAVGAGMMQGVMNIMDSITNAVNDPEVKKMLEEAANQAVEQNATPSAAERMINRVLSKA